MIEEKDPFIEELHRIDRLSREEIEDKLWNGCVHFSKYGLPYGYTWYLDNICEEWEGLVLGEYEAVMPLIKGRKLGFDYIYNPIFAQQLGIFATFQLDDFYLNHFLDQIPDEYKYVEMRLNEGNAVRREDFEIEERVNMHLDLNRPYEQIAEGFNQNLKRNIKKGEKAELKFSSQLKPETFVDFYIEHTGSRIPEFKERHKHSLMRNVYKAIAYSVGSLYAVRSTEGELLAAAFYMFTPSRLIHLSNAVSPKGKETGAMHFLVDRLIHINAYQPKVLDFEGSMIPSIARFYESFGATAVPYWEIRRNRLPWYAKLFKR